MFKSIIFCSCILLISSLSFQPLYKLRKTQKKIINTTTTMSSSRVPDQMHTHNTIQDLTELFKTLYPLFLLLVSVFLSLAGYFGKKCYQNDGKCKSNWFKVKSPTEYAQRREINQQRQIVVDQLMAHSLVNGSFV